MPSNAVHKVMFGYLGDLTLNFIFLACEITLPSANNPLSRQLNFEKEFEAQFGGLKEALEARGHSLIALDWKAPLSDMAHADGIVLGAPWNYQNYQDEFISKLEEIENAGLKLFNSSDIVKWNVIKTYLRELAELGAATIPTSWIDNPTKKDVDAVLKSHDTQGVVIKRQVGAGAFEQSLYKKGDEIPDGVLLDKPAMLQPFMPSIQTEGEYSFIFIDGEFSHALLKRAKTGDYRIQGTYGGYEENISPSDSDIQAAQKILSFLPFETPLYARVDVIRGLEESLLLMEVELIEPYLYPVEGPNMSKLYADALIKRASS